jgi:hypothetical protein
MNWTQYSAKVPEPHLWQECHYTFHSIEGRQLYWIRDIRIIQTLIKLPNLRYFTLLFTMLVSLRG